MRNPRACTACCLCPLLFCLQAGSSPSPFALVGTRYCAIHLSQPGTYAVVYSLDLVGVVGVVVTLGQWPPRHAGALL